MHFVVLKEQAYGPLSENRIEYDKKDILDLKHSPCNNWMDFRFRKISVELNENEIKCTDTGEHTLADTKTQIILNYFDLFVMWCVTHLYSSTSIAICH